MPEKKPNARKEKNEKKTTKIVDAIKNAVKALIDVGFYIFIRFLSGLSLVIVIVVLKSMMHRNVAIDQDIDCHCSYVQNIYTKHVVCAL